MSAHQVGDAHAEVEDAMRGRLANLRDLIAAQEWPLSMNGERLEELGIDVEQSQEAMQDAAAQAITELPLAVERLVQFEVVLSTGGPDDRLIFECDGGPDYHGKGEGHEPYELRRVLYRYSWTGSAEVELTGEDREVAEAFARRVVPELVE